MSTLKVGSCWTNCDGASTEMGNEFHVASIDADGMVLIRYNNGNQYLMLQKWVLDQLPNVKSPGSAAQKKIEIGSTVVLKSGGPPMTVESEDLAGKRVQCCWFSTWGEQESFIERWIPAACLVPIPEVEVQYREYKLPKRNNDASQPSSTAEPAVPTGSVG